LKIFHKNQEPPNTNIYLVMTKGIDKGPNVTTWWSSYFVCNAKFLVCFDFEIQKHHFFVYFPHVNKPNVHCW